MTGVQISCFGRIDGFASRTSVMSEPSRRFDVALSTRRSWRTLRSMLVCQRQPFARLLKSEAARCCWPTTLLTFALSPKSTLTILHNGIWPAFGHRSRCFIDHDAPTVTQKVVQGRGIHGGEAQSGRTPQEQVAASRGSGKIPERLQKSAGSPTGYAVHGLEQGHTATWITAVG